jgi:DNA-binding CsgD family transcriptional regulator
MKFTAARQNSPVFTESELRQGLYFVLSEMVRVCGESINLTPRQLRAATLYVGSGLTQAQIARRLGISQQGVGKLLKRVTRRYPHLRIRARGRRRLLPLPIAA